MESSPGETVEGAKSFPKEQTIHSIEKPKFGDWAAQAGWEGGKRFVP